MRKLHVILLLILAGCAPIQEQLQEQRPTPLTPLISPVEIDLHLRALNDPNTAGRATATQGFLQAAQYVADRLKETLVQPIADPEYFYPYSVSINLPVRADLVQYLTDSLQMFQPGVDFLIDGRTALDSARFHRVMLRPTLQTATPPVVMLPATEADSSILYRLRQNGVRAALLVTDTLQPALAPAPIDSLMLAQITPSAAARLLQLPESLFELHLLTVRNQLVVLPGVAELITAAAYFPHTDAYHVGGYIAGKHPEYARELVIVTTDMDGLGNYPGWGMFHPDYPGTRAAALLEVIRNTGSYSPYLQIPERTILFLFLSGARIGDQGLRAFLQALTWEKRQVRALIYVGPRPSTRRYLEALEQHTSWSIEIVPEPPTSPLPPAWTPQQVLAQERTRAQILARKLHDHLLPWLITPHPFAPASADTLPRPQD